MLFHLGGGGVAALHALERLKTSVKPDTGEVSGHVVPLGLRPLFSGGRESFSASQRRDSAGETENTSRPGGGAVARFHARMRVRPLDDITPRLLFHLHPLPSNSKILAGFKSLPLAVLGIHFIVFIKTLIIILDLQVFC